MIATTDDLVPYRCANPACPSRRTGRGQIVMRGLSTVGWCGEGYCRHCHTFTMADVTADGIIYRLRQPKNTTLG